MNGALERRDSPPGTPTDPDPALRLVEISQLAPVPHFPMSILTMKRTLAGSRRRTVHATSPALTA